MGGGVRQKKNKKGGGGAGRKTKKIQGYATETKNRGGGG